MSDCPLCELARGKNRETKVYADTEHFIVLDCLTCKKPLIVWKEHKPELNLLEELVLLRELMLIFKLPHLDKAVLHVRKTMRSCFSHIHYHWRP